MWCGSACCLHQIDAVYRGGGLTLEQLMAFAVTEITRGRRPSLNAIA